MGGCGFGGVQDVRRGRGRVFVGWGSAEGACGWMRCKQKVRICGYPEGEAEGKVGMPVILEGC